MKQTLFRSTFALATVLVVAACGGSHKSSGRKSGGGGQAAAVPPGLTPSHTTPGGFDGNLLAGLWMDQAALDDYVTDGADFCQRATVKFKERHGFMMKRFGGYPAVHILRITAGGDVFRWSPVLNAEDATQRQGGLHVGQIDSLGQPLETSNEYMISSPTFRLVSKNKLARVGDPNPFPVYSTAQPDKQDASSEDQVAWHFARISEPQAEAYVRALAECDPGWFKAQAERPGVPATLPAPTAADPRSTQTAPSAPAAAPRSTNTSRSQVPAGGFRGMPAAGPGNIPFTN